MYFFLVMEVKEVVEEVVGVCFFCFDGEERVFYVFLVEYWVAAVVLIFYSVLIGAFYSKRSVYLVVSLPGVACI